MVNEEWLSLSQVAETLGVHPTTVRTWADQGRLPVHRTQGGHRRFKRSEVDLCMKSQAIGGAVSMEQVVQGALRQTRLQIAEGHLENEVWYQKLDDETRNQYRRSGRNLLQAVMTFQLKDDKESRDEARAIGYEYASIGKRCGLSSAEAVNAFLFFRNRLLDAMLGVYESSSVRSAQAWGDMLRQTHTFTDTILLTLIETYDAFQRNSH
jgi:excisionase family DNA binding protein